MCKDWQYYLCLAAVAGLLAMAACLSSCRTVVPCVAETVVRDSVRVQHVLDSVYLYERDSIFVHAKRDTVWVERWRTRYKDAVRVERDTVRDVHFETKVEQVRYVPRYYKFTSWALWIVVALVLVRVAWWVAKTIKN
ncbi:MAG: hypothetical protein ACI4TV_04400 [Paludibacteraceae bacterium]